MKKTGILFAVLLIVSPLSAEISFGNSDLNKNNELLFTIRHSTPGTDSYSSLMYAKIADGMPSENPAPLTCYPEKMELLENGTLLQIRNRYGTAVYNTKSEVLKWTELAKTLPEKSVPVPVYKTSSNGEYACYIQKKSGIKGSLIIEKVKTGKKIILTENVLSGSSSIPVKWAPEGSFLVYEKNQKIYFCKPEALFDGVEIDEKYRKLGNGTINNIEWASEKYLAYIDDCILYKINTKELYTLGLYSDIIGQGKAMGRLPFNFNPKADSFSTNSEVNSIVVVQNNKLFTYLRVLKESCDYMDVVFSRPYTDSSASLTGSYVFWDNSGTPVLWQEKLPYNGTKEKGSVYKLGPQATKVLEIQDSGKPFISQDGSKVAFFAGSVIYVYDINTWKRLGELSGEKIICALWANRNVLYVGGEKTVRKWNLISNTVETISLSQATGAYWNLIENSVIANVQNGGKTAETENYRYNKEKGTWTKATVSIPHETSNQNGIYRVFTGKTSNKNYKNALYVRTLDKSAVTKALYPQSVKKSAEPKKVALVFDAYNNADGVAKILSVLKTYNIPGTFFMNGEFIRRYPSETRQIAANGYDCASMFFSATDLTDRAFVIDEDFVRRGLARNEDEFYQITGKELMLYWHAPYYSVTEEIIEAGKNAGYSYLNVEDNLGIKLSDSELTITQKIEQCLESLKKSKIKVIPVPAGITTSSSSDVVYEYLDVLICALLDSGYQITTLDNM